MVPNRLLAIFLVASISLAGCLGPGEDDEDRREDPAQDVDGPVLGQESNLPLAPTRAATLEEPPEPVLGRWWDYEVENLMLDRSISVTTVLAGLDEEEILIGLDAGTLASEAFVIHLPGLGEVKRDTLAFEAHEVWIMALEFPLAEGNQWTAKWYGGQDMTMTVDSVQGTTAQISVDHPDGEAALVYDAEVGNMVSFTVPGYADLELTDHGFGFEGEVMVPYGLDLVVCHGRAAGGLVIEDCADGGAGAPVETVVIEGDYDRFSFGLLVFDLGGAPVGSGSFSIEVTAPDGTFYSHGQTPDQAGNSGAMFSHDDPVGDWEMTALAVGNGAVLFEGAAYKTLNVTLGGV